MPYSQIIGAGKDALHVSYNFRVSSSRASRGTFFCTVVCERWACPANTKGRNRKTTGISVERRFVLKGGKVSEKAPNADEVRRCIEGITGRIRKAFDAHMRERTDDSDFIPWLRIENLIDSRVETVEVNTVFVTRSTSTRGARGVEYGGFLRKFMDEYRMSDGRSYRDSPRAMANARTMAFNLHRFSERYFGGTLTVQDLASPEDSSRMAQLLIRFLLEATEHQLTDSSVDNILTRLRTALSWAKRKGIVRDLDLTPYHYRASRQPKVALTQEEFQRVVQFKFDEKDTRLERVRDLWLFLCLTALRFGDCQKLDIICAVDAAFTVTTSKTGKRVTIPLFELTRDILRKYPNGLPRISNQKFNVYLKSVLEAVGLTRIVEVPVARGGREVMCPRRLCDTITSHSGRRQFVTLARLHGVPDAVIKEITGHVNLDEIDTYTHVPRETTVSLAKSLDPTFGRLSV